MGHPMARNLLRAPVTKSGSFGHYTAAKAKELADAEKGVFCKTPKEVGAAADCIFLCVGDTKMAREESFWASMVSLGEQSPEQ